VPGSATTADAGVPALPGVIQQLAIRAIRDVGKLPLAGVAER
jgi:hypothetical protein